MKNNVFWGSLILALLNTAVYSQSIEANDSSGNFGIMASEDAGVFGAFHNGNFGSLGSEDYAVFGNSLGNGNYGFLGGEFGAYGFNTGFSNYGLLGSSDYGVFGFNNENMGYLASDNFGAYGENSFRNGHLGGPQYGVYGESGSSRYGFLGGPSHGVYGARNDIFGYLAGTYGAYGESATGSFGYLGSTASGVYGEHSQGHFGQLGTIVTGVYGEAFTHELFATHGVMGRHENGHQGSLGNANSGVEGEHTNGNIGRLGAPNAGVIGVAGGSNELAGRFSGDVSIIDGGDLSVAGNISKGGGSFKIDHPLDPENMYLSHSFVESPDMMNVYNGNAVTDDKGFAVVELPAYFEELNKNFRYQLTVIGTFSHAIISSKIHNNTFMIQTEKPNVEVSWQVTGVRKDPWANEHRIIVEEAKPLSQKGKYLHPSAYSHR